MSKVIAAIGVLAVALLVTGCGMTNEDIIREIKKCEDAGLKPDQVVNGLTYDVVAVHCSPKETPK